MERVISPTTRLGKGPAAFGQLASNVPRNHRPNPHFPIGQFAQIAGSIPYLVSILLSEISEPLRIYPILSLIGAHRRVRREANRII